jgi:DNA ligase-4
LEAHLGGDDGEDQNIVFSDKGNEQRSAKATHEDTTLVSQEKAGPRKRGRPVGGGTKKVKPAGNHARRVRAQIGKKRAKICEYESDENVDGRPVEQEIDTRVGSVDFPQDTQKHVNIQDTKTAESSEPSEAVEQKREDFKDSECERVLVPEIEMTDRHNDQNNQVSAKLEFFTDPMQAMLFDMIPSLATQKVEQSTYCSAGVEKLPEISNAEKLPETSNAEKIQEISNEPAITTKKKKVSYKDIAGDLLKDW